MDKQQAVEILRNMYAYINDYYNARNQIKFPNHGEFIDALDFAIKELSKPDGEIIKQS